MAAGDTTVGSRPIGEESFDRNYLEHPLTYCSRYNTREELTKKIYEICAILQQPDSTTEAVTKYLKLDFKALKVWGAKKAKEIETMISTA